MNKNFQTWTLRTYSLKDQGTLCKPSERVWGVAMLKSYCYVLAFFVLFWVFLWCLFVGGINFRIFWWLCWALLFGCFLMLSEQWREILNIYHSCAIEKVFLIYYQWYSQKPFNIGAKLALSYTVFNWHDYYYGLIQPWEHVACAGILLIL